MSPASASLRRDPDESSDPPAPPRRLRVVELIATFDPAGAERHLALLAGALDRRRFDVRAIALTRGGAVVERLLDAAGVPHEVIGKRRKLDPGALVRLRGRLAALAPDVLHTHLFTANAYGRAAALLARVPVLIATEENPDPYKTALHVAIDRALAAATARIVCVSASIRDAYLARGLPPEKLVVIHNAVDAAALDRAAQGVEPVPGRIVAACRLDPQKDVPTLIDAVALLRGRGIEATLDIAGEGPERPRIEAAIAARSLGGAVRLLGFCDDVPRRIAGAACFALSSRWEGFPVVVLEALALGRPVVATRAGGVDEMIEDGVTGRLVPPGDAGALAAALADVLGAPERARALGAAARVRVRERFSVEVMAAAYERLFEEELSRVRDRRRGRGA